MDDVHFQDNDYHKMIVEKAYAEVEREQALNQTYKFYFWFLLVL